VLLLLLPPAAAAAATAAAALAPQVLPAGTASAWQHLLLLLLLATAKAADFCVGLQTARLPGATGGDQGKVRAQRAPRGINRSCATTLDGTRE
jgi:hypothetical protein